MSDSSGTYANGCFWFGSGPFASFWLELYGETLATPGTRYCQALANSTGAAATILALGSASASAGSLTVEAEPVPARFGLFIHGDQRQELPFGNGFLCVSGSPLRGKPFHPSGDRLAYTFDNSDSAHSLMAYVGTLRYFQAFFRDPAAGGAAFNSSDAIAVAILP